MTCRTFEIAYILQSCMKGRLPSSTYTTRLGCVHFDTMMLEHGALQRGDESPWATNRLHQNGGKREVHMVRSRQWILPMRLFGVCSQLTDPLIFVPFSFDELVRGFSQRDSALLELLTIGVLMQMNAFDFPVPARTSTWRALYYSRKFASYTFFSG